MRKAPNFTKKWLVYTINQKLSILGVLFILMSSDPVRDLFLVSFFANFNDFLQKLSWYQWFW